MTMTKPSSESKTAKRIWKRADRRSVTASTADIQVSASSGSTTQELHSEALGTERRAAPSGRPWAPLPAPRPGRAHPGWHLASAHLPPSPWAPPPPAGPAAPGCPLSPGPGPSDTPSCPAPRLLSGRQGSASNSPSPRAPRALGASAGWPQGAGPREGGHTGSGGVAGGSFSSQGPRATSLLTPSARTARWPEGGR